MEEDDEEESAIQYPPQEATIFFASSRVDLDHHLNIIRSGLFFGVIVILLISIITILFIVDYCIKPVKKLSADIKDMDESKLESRLSPQDLPKEIQIIACSFNQLLDRI